jgi:WD40 repeat protein
LAVTSDSQRIVSGSYDHTLKVWDLHSLLSTNDIGNSLGHSSAITGLAVTSDSQRIVSGSYDHTLKVWNADGKLLYDKTEIGPVKDIAISPDCRFIISICEKEISEGVEFNIIRIWNLLPTKVEFERPIGAFRQSIIDFVLTKYGHKIICAFDDNNIGIWNIRSGKKISSFIHSKPQAMTITSDDHYVISALPDGTITKWDVESPNQVKIFAGHLEDVQNVIVTSDDHYVISSSYNGMIRSWNLNTGDPVLTISDYKEHIYCMAITQDNQHLITASMEGTIIVWRVKNGLNVKPLAKAVLDGILTSITVPKDDNRLIVGDAAGNLYCLSFVKSPTECLE